MTQVNFVTLAKVFGYLAMTMMGRNKNYQTGHCRCLQLMAFVPCTALENQFIRIWCKIVRLKSSAIDDKCGMVMMREWSMAIVQIRPL